ncbi:MAG TPA: hypothetical protein PK006_01240 [Saprospiraceae bacterium]|nr:hypothetical protein [Saprospiraceae bacterium]
MEPELIERYIANELQGEEKILFEEKLKVDANLKAEVEAYTAIATNLRAVQNLQLKERLMQIENKSYSVKSSPSKTKLYLIAITTLVLLFTIFYFVRNKTSDPNLNEKQNTEKFIAPTQENILPESTPSMPIDTNQKIQNPKNPPKKAIAEKKQNKGQDEQLYAMNFVPFLDDDMMSMTRSDGEQSNFDKFIALYLAKDYKNALISYNSIDESLRDTDNLLFLKANVLVMLGRLKEGRDLFEQIISNGESKYTEQAKNALKQLRNK